MTHKKKEPSTLFLNKWLPDFEEMTDEEAGMLFKAVMRFSVYGENSEDQFTDRFLRSRYRDCVTFTAANKEWYEQKCEENRINGAKGGRPPKNTHQSSNDAGGKESPRSLDLSFKTLGEMIEEYDP